MKTLIRSLSLGLVAFASVLCIPKALATDVSGTLSSHTTWSEGNSPYVVTGPVLIESGVTVTIEAGVEVRFGSDNYIKAEGHLVARGSQSKKIVFTSNNDSPSST